MLATASAVARRRDALFCVESMMLIEGDAITFDPDLWQMPWEDCCAAYPLMGSEGPSQMLLSPLPPQVRQA